MEANIQVREILDNISEKGSGRFLVTYQDERGNVVPCGCCSEKYHTHKSVTSAIRSYLRWKSKLN